MLVKSGGLILPFPNQYYPSPFKDEFWPVVLQPVVRINAQDPLLLFFCQIHIQACNSAETWILQFETVKTVLWITPSFIKHCSHSLGKPTIYLKTPGVC